MAHPDLTPDGVCPVATAARPQSDYQRQLRNRYWGRMTILPNFWVPVTTKYGPAPSPASANTPETRQASTAARASDRGVGDRTPAANLPRATEAGCG